MKKGSEILSKQSPVLGQVHNVSSTSSTLQVTPTSSPKSSPESSPSSSPETSPKIMSKPMSHKPILEPRSIKDKHTPIGFTDAEKKRILELVQPPTDTINTTQQTTSILNFPFRTNLPQDNVNNIKSRSEKPIITTKPISSVLYTDFTGISHDTPQTTFYIDPNGICHKTTQTFYVDSTGTSNITPNITNIPSIPVNNIFDSSLNLPHPFIKELKSKAKHLCEKSNNNNAADLNLKPSEILKTSNITVTPILDHEHFETPTTNFDNIPVNATQTILTGTRSVFKPSVLFNTNFSQVTTLLRPKHPNETGGIMTPKHYYHNSVRSPDPKNKDPQAIINNVKVGQREIQHPELVKEVCTKTDCKDLICSTHCAPIVETKSVGHATKGTPNVKHGTVQRLNSNKTLDNKLLPQNAVFYNEPHDTTPNQKELQPHTDNLNNDPDALQTIKDNAK